MKRLIMNDRGIDRIEIDDLQGNLMDIITTLERKYNALKSTGYRDIEMEGEYDEGGYHYFFLNGRRDETDEELGFRKAQAKREKDRAKLAAAAKKECELKELARLKRKYE